ncbi:uncharacterized protein [Argopecten irradians]|uniref:uncharacterized protein n=1 Tax=Argopecten irradians TaxID=31199 RepID=UPI0037227CBC
MNNNGNVRPNRDDEDDGDSAGDDSFRNPIPKNNLPASALPGRRRGAVRSKGVCRDGWKLAEMNNVPICIYVNHKELSWDDAKDSCRQDFGFLLKAEAPVYVDYKSIGEYLRRQEIINIWTGLHEEEGTLVWDELAPHKVRPYNDFMESRLKDDRIWDWDIDDTTDDNDVCGDLDLSKVQVPNEEEIFRRRRKRRNIQELEKIRKRRNTDENPHPEMAFSQLMTESLTQRPETMFQNTDSPPQRPFRQYGHDRITDNPPANSENSETNKPFQDLAFLKDIQSQEGTPSPPPEQQQQHNLYGQASEWHSTTDGDGEAAGNPVLSEAGHEKQVHVTKISKHDSNTEQHPFEGIKPMPAPGHWNTDSSSVVPTSGPQDSGKNSEDITPPPNDDGDNDPIAPPTLSSRINTISNNEIGQDIRTLKTFATQTSKSDDTQPIRDVEVAPPTPETQDEILRTIPVTESSIDLKDHKQDLSVTQPSERTKKGHADIEVQTAPSIPSSLSDDIPQSKIVSNTIAPTFSFIPTIPTSDDVTPVNNDDDAPTTKSVFDDVTTKRTFPVTDPTTPITGATQISIPDLPDISTAPTSRRAPIRSPPTVNDNEDDDGKDQERTMSKITTVEPSFDFTSQDPFINTLGILGQIQSNSNKTDSANTTSVSSSEYLKTTKDDTDESTDDGSSTDSDSKDKKESEDSNSNKSKGDDENVKVVSDDKSHHSNSTDENNDNYDELSNGAENESLENVENTTMIDSGKHRNITDDEGSYRDSNESDGSGTASNLTNDDSGDDSTTVVMKLTTASSDDKDSGNDDSEDSGSNDSDDNADITNSQITGDENVNMTFPEDPTAYDENGGEQLENVPENDEGGEIVEPSDINDFINDELLDAISNDPNSIEGNDRVGSTESDGNDESTQNVIGIASTTLSGTDDNSDNDSDDKTLVETNEDTSKDDQQNTKDESTDDKSNIENDDTESDQKKSDNQGLSDDEMNDSTTAADSGNNDEMLNEGTDENTSNKQSDDDRSSDDNTETTTAEDKSIDGNDEIVDDNQSDDNITNDDTNSDDVSKNDDGSNDDVSSDKSMNKEEDDNDVSISKGLNNTTIDESGDEDGDTLNSVPENNKNKDDSLNDESVDTTTDENNDDTDDASKDDNVDSSANDDIEDTGDNLDDKGVDSKTSDNNKDTDDVSEDANDDSTAKDDKGDTEDVSNDANDDDENIDSTGSDDNGDTDDASNDGNVDGTNNDDTVDDDILKSLESLESDDNELNDDVSNDKSVDDDSEVREEVSDEDDIGIKLNDDIVPDDDDVSKGSKMSKNSDSDDDDSNDENDDKVASIPIDLELMESIQEADEMSIETSDDTDKSNENSDDLNDNFELEDSNDITDDMSDDGNSEIFDDINEIDSVVIPTELVARMPTKDDQEDDDKVELQSEEKIDDREDSDSLSPLGEDVSIGDMITLRTFLVEDEDDDYDLRSSFAGRDNKLRIHPHLGSVEEIEEFVPPADKREHIAHSNRQYSQKKTLGMKLSQCQIRKPSVCYSPPIVLEETASSCPPGWYGHIFSKKCYKVIVSRMPFAAAQERCQNEGGRLASMGNSKFNADLVLMSILKSQTEGFVVGPTSTFWVQRLPSNVQCRALTVNGYMETSCNTPAEVVCERDTLIKGQAVDDDNDGDDDTIDIDDDDDEIHEAERIYFSSKTENSVLQCGLTNKNKELPTIWFKDGKIVDIKLERRSPSLVSLLGVMGRPLTPLPEPALTTSNALELGPMFRKTLEYSSSQKLSNEMFQGKYWCEVWEMHPFNRRRSKSYSVKYTDVITFRGTIDMPDMSHKGVILHNMINQQNDKLSNILKDINYIHDKILPVLRQNIPTVQSVSTYGSKIEDAEPLQLGYYTFLKTTDNYTMADENMAYLVLRKELREVMKNTQMLLTLPGKTPIHIVRSIDFTSTVACPLDHLKDEVTGLVATFPRSSIDTQVNSIEMCEGSVAGRASCKGDYDTGAYWTDISVTKTCNNESNTQSEEPEEEDDEDEEEGIFEKMTVEDRLRELAEMDMEDDNVEGIMEETASIVEKVEEMTALDVDYIADIMDKTVKVHKITKEVGMNVLKTMDKVMSIDEDEIEKANEVSHASQRILKSFEKVAENIYLEDDGKLRIVKPNVALEVWNLNQMKRPIIGLAARQGKAGRLEEVFNEDRIFTLYNQSELYGDIDAAIELPSDLIASEMIDGKGVKDDTRLYMMVYRDGRLFQGNSKGRDKIDVTRDLRLGVLNSYIISASISGRQIKGLKQKVKTVFKPLQSPANDERKCAFWDFELNNKLGGWSTAGCVYNGQANGRDICLCDHLTNFAVLIDFYGQAEPVDPDHDFSLSIISLIGLSLSILGLSLTIISYVFFRKLRQGRAQQTLFNLALAMLCSWVVFLTGIRQTHNFIGCIIVAVLLHYFILSSFMWMLMEAFLQYLTFVKVLGTYVTRYTLKTVVIAWGLPLIPIIVVLSLDPNLYRGGDRYCWMSLEAFYYAFALPIGLIILCNLVVFILTVTSICRRPTGLRSNQSKQKIAITNLQAAITSFVLLGLTWLLGYLAIADARVVFQYAFTILNSLQGFFIFVLFVARKKQVRDQWLIVCCCKDPKMEKAMRSLSASASIPSTCSGRSSGSYGGRSERSDSTRTTSSFVNNDYETIYTVPYSKHSRESLYYRKV